MSRGIGRICLHGNCKFVSNMPSVASKLLVVGESLENGEKSDVLEDAIRT